nr:hypothetical protein CFP56_11996 [Quercus suber]
MYDQASLPPMATEQSLPELGPPCHVSDDACGSAVSRLSLLPGSRTSSTMIEMYIHGPFIGAGTIADGIVGVPPTPWTRLPFEHLRTPHVSAADQDLSSLLIIPRVNSRIFPHYWQIYRLLSRSSL